MFFRIPLFIKPKIIVFFITYRCNCKCIMCYAWQKQNNYKELSLNEIDKFFSNKLINSNLEILNLTGGEPTLRKDLDEIIKIVLKYCYKLKRIDLPTNAVNTEEILDQIEKILALILPTSIKLSVTVSLDGIGKTHEDIRGVSGIFKKIEQTIQGLRELNKLYPALSLGINSVITKFNYRNLKENLDFAIKNHLNINFTLAALSEIGVESISSKKDFDLNNIDKIEKEKIILFLEEILKQRYIHPIYGKFIIDFLKTGRRKYDCNFKRGRAFLIEPDGNIYMCGNFKKFKLGNLIEQDFIFKDIHNKIRYFLVEFNKRCPTCRSNCYLE